MPRTALVRTQPSNGLLAARASHELSPALTPSGPTTPTTLRGTAHRATVPRQRAASRPERLDGIPGGLAHERQPSPRDGVRPAGAHAPGTLCVHDLRTIPPSSPGPTPKVNRHSYRREPRTQALLTSSLGAKPAVSNARVISAPGVSPTAATSMPVITGHALSTPANSAARPGDGRDASWSRIPRLALDKIVEALNAESLPAADPRAYGAGRGARRLDSAGFEAGHA
jgi:hypothetical protein